jgi:autotransporter translocation and assembly factor TamB
MYMGRLIRFAIHSLILSIIAALLLLCTALALLQTNWAKQKIAYLAIDQLQQNGIDAEIEGVEGQLPFSWKVDRAKLRFSNHQALTIENATLRFAFFPLLRGYLAIDYLSAASADYDFYQVETSSLSSASQWNEYQMKLQEFIIESAPPLHLNIRHLAIDRVKLNNLTTHQEFHFSLEAKGKWKKNNSEFFLFCKSHSLDSLPLDLELFLQGRRSTREINFTLKSHIGAVESLPYAHLFFFKGDALFEIQLKGPWNTWEALVWNTNSPPTSLLSGRIKGRVSGMNTPQLPLAVNPRFNEPTLLQDLFDRDWFASAEFSLNSQRACLIKKLLFHSDLVHLHVRGELLPDLASSRAVATYAISDLTPLSPLFQTSLQGSARGKGLYNHHLLKVSLSTDQLNINHYPIEQVKTHLQARLESSLWRGELKCLAKGGVLPFFGQTMLSWKPGQFLELADIALQAHETSVGGHLSIDLPDFLFEGSLYVNARHLSQLSPFFPHTRLDGGLGAELLFSHSSSQEIKANLAFKNIRFNDLLVDDLRLNAILSNCKDAPQGMLDLRAEKLFTPQAYLNQIQFVTCSSGKQWPFSLTVKGSNEESYSLDASGSWEKEGDSFLWELDHVQANILDNPIALTAPFFIEWSPTHLAFSPSDWTIGYGKLSTSASFTSEHCSAQIDLEHLPLKIFTVLKPTFSLEGSVSAHGHLSGDREGIQGALNISLEEADLLHYGKKKPWRAKGTLQAHLDHQMLQVHTDLRAVGEQFLDFSASLPINYHLYPFRIEVDDLKPLSCELVAEGKIQDIFDFVNMGTHHITGFVACRLLMSQTLAHPALIGEIEWQNGTYENYYTGTQLREIFAQAEALNREIHLTRLTARDEKNGILEAEGSVQLKPEARYPYAFQCELEQLHLIRFDTIDCSLTGPLYVTGSSQSALLEGNLVVPYATIKIPDELPYEIPQLPATYINFPSYIPALQIAPLPVFPLHIDLELTADKDIHVEGKGLNSEWEGTVRLTGTNANVAAAGTLSLTHGEFLFSGKAFKLTEGEIIFNDKPSSTAYLKLSGALNLSDIEITAQLRGPLTSPLLTFQSNPHLPTSTILARILFNKDISDISHPEAVQLANTLMSLSGGAGPDVLETIRKSLGVDRLTIISSSPGSDQIAVQIGKYLTRGVLITLSQSATSSQVIVEVELKKGFVLQAETQEQEEGKFSLKWRKSY